MESIVKDQYIYILILNVKKKHYGLFYESTFMRKYFLSNTFDGLCSITTSAIARVENYVVYRCA